MSFGTGKHTSRTRLTFGVPSACVWILLSSLPVALAAPTAKHPQTNEQRPHHKSPLGRTMPSRIKRTARVKKVVDTEAKAEANELRPHYLFMGLVGIALGVLFLRHRRHEIDEAAPEKTVGADQGGREAHAPRPVFLDKDLGPDPATKSRPPAQVPMLDLNSSQEAENQAAALEIERLTTSDLKVRVNAATVPIQLRRGILSLLPATFAEHFESLPEETVRWTAPLRVVGSLRGEVCITNFRLLAVYERTRITCWPPARKQELRRHQLALSSLARFETVRVQQPIFLGVGVLTFLWYPIGTILACLAVGCYFGVPRPQLSVAVGFGSRRYYPLQLPDQREALKILEQLTGRSQATEGAAPPQKQAS